MVPGVFKKNLVSYIFQNDLEQEQGHLNFVHDDDATELLFGCLKYLWPGEMKNDVDQILVAEHVGFVFVV